MTPEWYLRKLSQAVDGIPCRRRWVDPVLAPSPYLREVLAMVPHSAPGHVGHSGGRGRKPTRVRCVETGVVFSDYRDAAKSVKRSPEAVRYACLKGTPAGGKHWVKQEQQQ